MDRWRPELGRYGATLRSEASQAIRGEILRGHFLKELGLSANKLALDLRLPAPRIYEIVNGERDITPDTAPRLAHYFQTTPEFWMNLQTSYDLASSPT